MSAYIDPDIHGLLGQRYPVAKIGEVSAGLAQPVLARTIDERVCGPLTDDDAQWGEVDDGSGLTARPDEPYARPPVPAELTRPAPLSAEQQTFNDSQANELASFTALLEKRYAASCDPRGITIRPTVTQLARPAGLWQRFKLALRERWPRVFGWLRARTR